MQYAVGIDIGGTFTDFVFVRSDGDVAVQKVLSTPGAPEEAVLEGLSQFSDSLGIDVHRFLREVEVFVHGTTIATNTVIQRNGPSVGLICTEGHRDILALRDGYKWDRFNIHMDPPDPFVERRVRLPVRERVDYRGAIVTPLDSESVDRAIDRLEREGVQSVAVALLWSMLNPEHEQTIRQRIEERLPGVDVVLSSEVLPIIREWPRTSATVLSAYIKPGLARYLRNLSQRLRENGFRNELLVMQASGGTSTIGEIERRPIFGLGSGPAAAPAAALAVAKEFGIENLITGDMGGTSFDVTVVTDMRPHTSAELEVDHMPIGIQAVESHSIGAGGGSIAWIDSGGSLRVGPRSAGSVPGPACYGRGGREPTVSDANLVLGYLDEGNLLGGTLRLDTRLAKEAIAEFVAGPLGLGVPEAAFAIFSVVSHNMVEAIKVLSIQRGVDPRDYVFVIGGGAGSIHGSWLARELGIATVLSPREAGAFCAMGMVAADVRHDYLRAMPQKSTSWEPARVTALYDALEAEAVEALGGEGIAREDVELRRSVDAKYENQLHELTIPVPSGRDLNAGDIEEINAAFHALHRRLYTFDVEDAPLDFYHWRLTALGKISRAPRKPSASANGHASSALKGVRPVFFDRDAGYSDTAIYDGELVGHGFAIDGPAVVERVTTTIVVRPGERLTLNPYGTFVIETRS